MGNGRSVYVEGLTNYMGPMPGDGTFKWVVGNSMYIQYEMFFRDLHDIFVPPI